MGFGKFLKDVRKLSRINRWETEYMTEDVRPSVASHTFTVLQTAQMLGIIEEKHSATVDWKVLYQKALNHDVPEMYTGDILSSVKNRKKTVKQQIEIIEKELMELNTFSHLPAEYVDIYRQVLFNGKDNTLEGRILKAADVIDAIIECLIEIQRNNPEQVFLEAYKNCLEDLRTIDLACVKYFLDTILEEFLDQVPPNYDIRAITYEILQKK